MLKSPRTTSISSLYSLCSNSVMKPGIPVLMSSTVITPFCVTIGQKMSEFQKALFIVSFSLILLTMVISTEILQKI